MRFVCFVAFVALVLTLAAVLPPAHAADPYGDAYALALRQNQSLAVFVNVSPVSLAGCVSCQVPSFPGAFSPGVVLCVPDGQGGFNRIADVYGPCGVERLTILLRDYRRPIPYGIAAQPRPRPGFSLRIGVGLSLQRPAGGCPGGRCH